jgi:nucleoside-diphosphate-sugar epimerase
MGALFELFYKALAAKSEPPMTRFLAEELATAHWFNIEAAKRDFGYQPKVAIEEGLRRLKRWLDDNPYGLH